MGASPPLEDHAQVATVRARFDARHAYTVFFGRDLLAPADTTLAGQLGSQRALFVIDRGLSERRPDLDLVVRRYAEAHAIDAAPPMTIPGGEICKNDPTILHALYRAVHELRLDRHACVVAIGGGAVLDVVGYAVATAHRGLRLVRMPSTVLAQADSGVGVKNGINYLGKKNFLGTFAPPVAVLADAALLSTLELRDVRAGCAEAVKVALLRDPVFFAWLHRHADALAHGEPQEIEQLVRRCASLHVDHIATSGDPFERGSSRPLDFGHWAAHKLESLTDNALRHGEAVAIGMALDMIYASLANVCDERLVASVLSMLDAIGLPISHEALADPRLEEGLDEFREHLGGELTVPLIRDVGVPIDVHEIDRDLLARARDALLARRAA